MNARVLWRMVAMNVMMTLAYRGAFLILMVNTVAVPLISLLVWLTVSEQGVRLPYTRDQFVTYYVLLGVVAMLTGVWLAAYEADEIRLGRLSPWLLRPAPYIAHQLGNNIGEKIIKLPLLLPLVVLVAVAFRGDFHLPAASWLWALFVLATILAAALAFLLDFVIGALAFWVQDVRGLVRLKELAAALLAGEFVPLALFPHSLSGFLEAHPFRYTLSFPLEIATGALDGGALLRGFAWQAVWLIGLLVLYRAVWRRGLRLYASTGG